MSDPSFGSFSEQLTTLSAIKGTAGVLRFVDIVNTGTAAAYLEFFDAAAATAVALGTTTPKFSFPVAGSATRTLGDVNEKFANGIIAAATTTFNGGIVASSALIVNGTFD